jgi:hypothetical protein
MICGWGAPALINFCQHTLAAPIGTSLGSRVLVAILRLSGAEHLNVQCEVTPRIRGDDLGVLSLVLQHLPQETLNAFIHTCTLMLARLYTSGDMGDQATIIPRRKRVRGLRLISVQFRAAGPAKGYYLSPTL